MICPGCEQPLKRMLYEDVPVYRCETCYGHLLLKHRLKRIQCSRGRSVEQLKKEVIDQQQPDTKNRLRCPHCLKMMKKRLIPKPAAMGIDVCEQCNLVWLDGGELARLQLSYQIGAQSQEAERMRRRHESMTPEEREEFAENLDKLPEGENLMKWLYEIFFVRRSSWW